MFIGFDCRKCWVNRQVLKSLAIGNYCKSVLFGLSYGMYHLLVIKACADLTTCNVKPDLLAV